MPQTGKCLVATVSGRPVVARSVQLEKLEGSSSVWSYLWLWPPSKVPALSLECALGFGAPQLGCALQDYSPRSSSSREACACTAGSQFSCGFTPISYFQQSSSYLSRWFCWRKCAVGCIHRAGNNSGSFMEMQVLEECRLFVLHLHWASAGCCAFCDHPGCF